MKHTYVSHADKLIGHVDMTGASLNPRIKEILANKLLTFEIKVLANSFCIIVG